MTTSFLKDKVQLITFCALVICGLSLAVGLFTSYQKWFNFAAVLGPWLMLITGGMYLIKLVSAIYRNAARDFWSDLWVLNQGMVLGGIEMFDPRRGGEEFLSMLALASVIGLILAWTLYRSGAVSSRYVLIIFHVLVFLLSVRGWNLLSEPLPSVYLSYEGLVFLCIAAILIWLPLLYAATAVRASKVTDVIA